MKTLVRIAKSRVAQTFLLVAALYWILTLFIDHRFLRAILDTIVFVLSLAIIVVYAPLASEELFKDRTTRSGRLLVSMVLIWSVMMALRGLSIYRHGFGRLEDIANSRTFGFILWVAACAAVLGLAAPSGEDETRSPYRYRNWIIIAIAFGCAIGGFFIGMQWH